MTINTIIGSRPFQAAAAACVLLGLSVPAHAEVVNARFTGKIQAASCSIVNPVINVPLGTHNTSEFAAPIGSVVSDVPFTLGIRCPTTAVQVLVTPSSTNIVDASNGVIGVAGGATGVGIQLLNKQKMPVKLGVVDDQGKGHALTWDMQYYARYYRTEANIGTGDANGSATFTVTYR
ncbi:fimbrial protein [Achromobacter sp. DH1f]|uniref:fimbrial protein n=1 Tax=Achromobacter sp. DH1f TaxID=1397275 RepID=UPI00046AAACF|nr:fimbrial protein [Achromobacter sp. DH1f]